MPQVIEWVNAGSDDIVYRYPDENIMWGAQLVVHEYEYAVFFRDGKSYDTLGPGRHTLTTLNLPLITKALSRVWVSNRHPSRRTLSSFPTSSS